MAFGTICRKMTVGKAVRSIMKAHDWRSEDIAAQSGVGVRTIAKIVNDSGYRPSRLVVIALRQVPGFSELYDGAAIAS